MVIENAECLAQLAESQHTVQKEALGAAIALADGADTLRASMSGMIEARRVSHGQHNFMAGHALPGRLAMTLPNVSGFQPLIGEQTVGGLDRRFAAAAFRDRCLRLRRPIFKHDGQPFHKTAINATEMLEFALRPARCYGATITFAFG